MCVSVYVVDIECLLVMCDAFADSCKKSAVVFDEAIASFDVINCQSVQAQVGLPLCLLVCLYDCLCLSASFIASPTTWNSLWILSLDF